MRVASSEQLVMLNDIARERGLPKYFPDEFTSSIDPDGAHVAVFARIMDDELTNEPFVRVSWVVRTTVGNLPAYMSIDTSIEAYLGLPVTDTASSIPVIH